MRRIFQPGRRTFCCACALAVLLAAGTVWAVWATRSQNLWEPSRGKVAYAQIILQCDDPYASGGGVSTWHSMDTDSPMQVAELVSLVSQYPYNRKADLGPQNKAIYGPETTMWVSVTCGAKNGKNYWAEELVCSDGSMQAEVSGGKLFPCAVGRFGTARTAEYCTRLQQFFAEKTENPDWRTGQNITQHPWSAGSASASSGVEN
jgi:hypothetical protein